MDDASPEQSDGATSPMPESPEHQHACTLLEAILLAWIARTARDASAEVARLRAMLAAR